MIVNNFVTNLHKKFTYRKVLGVVLSTVVISSNLVTATYAVDMSSMIAAGVTKKLSDEDNVVSGDAADKIVIKPDVKVKAAISISDNVKSDKNVVSKNIANSPTVKEEKKETEESKDTDPIDERFGDKLVMADVENSVNIRSEADEESDIVGKLYKDCAGTILDKGDSWTKLETGGVTGWVSNDYLCFGEEAKKLAKQTGSLVATVNTETLRIRSEESVDSSVYGLLAEGEKIEAIEEDGEWVKVRYSDDTQGYVSAEFVSLDYEIDEGESIEAIKAREEAEAAKKKAEAEKKAKIAASRTTNKVNLKGSAIDSSTSDAVLLAALIDCEAGTQPYDGKLAVGAVVVNRAKGRYGSIYNAVFAPGQFGPASSGKVAAVVARGPSASALAAANEALSGVSNIGTATHFRNTNSGYGGIVIGNHVFW